MAGNPMMPLHKLHPQAGLVLKCVGAARMELAEPGSHLSAWVFTGHGRCTLVLGPWFLMQCLRSFYPKLGGVDLRWHREPHPPGSSLLGACPRPNPWGQDLPGPCGSPCPPAVALALPLLPLLPHFQRHHLLRASQVNLSSPSRLLTSPGSSSISMPFRCPQGASRNSDSSQIVLSRVRDPLALR